MHWDSPQERERQLCGLPQPYWSRSTYGVLNTPPEGSGRVLDAAGTASRVDI